MSDLEIVIVLVVAVTTHATLWAALYLWIGGKIGESEKREKDFHD